MNYKVQSTQKPLHIVTQVPGSKSITNRALLMAALAEGKTCLSGVLFSEDSRNFLACLQALGFRVEIHEPECRVTVWGEKGKIPVSEGEIYVGSAGTAARFLTAMLALSGGKYVIQASEQMKKRPMKPLFDALEKMGARFFYLEEEGKLPVRILGSIHPPRQVEVDISKSTQFLSALLMAAPMLEEGLQIRITSEKKTGAYVGITRKMMEDFGCPTRFDGQVYEIEKGARYTLDRYEIEPDVSAACYFYAMAALTGGTALVKDVHFDSVQGDLKFLSVLERMGCTLAEKEAGIELAGPACLKGVDVDMNDFSDQTMTLAAIAPFANSPVIIRNVAHIRLQESDRLQGIINELGRMGIACEAFENGLRIMPGNPVPAIIETYEDHRMAMAFAVTGLRAEGIEIRNPGCCKKTFENYFKKLEEITGK